MKKYQTRVSITIKGDGEICPKCKNVMQRREHKHLTEKQKKQPYYFSEWDVCVTYPCRHTQHYNKYKVYNNNDMAIYSKAKDEEANLLSFIRTF